MDTRSLKVVSVNSDGIEFDGGIVLSSHHDQDCCENHELTFDDLTMADFDGLLFNLEGDDFFRKIEDFGIELIPLSGHSVRIPGHGSNNGYYGTNLALTLRGRGMSRDFDITECQVIRD